MPYLDFQLGFARPSRFHPSSFTPIQFEVTATIGKLVFTEKSQDIRIYKHNQEVQKKIELANTYKPHLLPSLSLSDFTFNDQCKVNVPWKTFPLFEKDPPQEASYNKLSQDIFSGTFSIPLTDLVGFPFKKDYTSQTNDPHDQNDHKQNSK